MTTTNEHLTARAVWFEAPGRIGIRREQCVPAAGEQLVRSEIIAISHGTEMLFYEGPFPHGQLLEARETVGAADDYPIKYGYMNVGVTGDNRRVFAFAPHQDLFALPSDSLLPVPDGIAPEDAVLYPSVETAVQIVHDAAPLLGERVLVTGLGVIGLIVSILLRRIDVEVVAADPVAARRARAAVFGCVTVDPDASDARARIIAATEGTGPDVAINTSARSAGLQLAIDVLPREGRAVEASWYGDKRTELDLGAAFHRRRITIRASQVSHLNPVTEPRWTRARRTSLVWRLIREVRPSELVTHRFPLDAAARAYELIREHPEEVLQVVLVP